MKPSPILAVGITTAAYLAIASAAAAYTRNSEFLFYIAVVICIGVAILFLHRRVPFSAGVLWGLCVWGLLHVCGGLVQVPATWPINGNMHVLYSLWLIPGLLKYDHIVHAYGFGIATWACWQLLRAQLLHPFPATGVLVLCVLAGMGLGALNEVIEFTATLLLPNTNVGGYANTGWDLVANLAGCLTASLLITFKRS